MTAPDPLCLLAVLAHPDDESMGLGSTLARYAAAGVETYLVTATRGERGWQGEPAENPGLERLGQIRTAELAAAARVLGLREVHYLGYLDGELDRAPADDAVRQIADHIRRLRPQVVVTFGPDGAYGHPDHIAISQLTTAAVVVAADPTYDAGPPGRPAHRVLKLYYAQDTEEGMAAFEAIFGDIGMEVDGRRRVFPGWPEWAVTAAVDGAAYMDVAAAAIACHRSQIIGWPPLDTLPAATRALLLGTRYYYRAYSLVNGGRDREDDLFAGIIAARTRP